MGMDDMWDKLELMSDDDEDYSSSGGDGENKGSDDDDNGDEEEDDTHGAAQHVLVLLDCSSSMWQKFLPNPKNFMDASKTDEDVLDTDTSDDDDDDEKYISPMDQALHVLYDLVRQQVRAKGTGGRGLGSTRDGFGILLYNTKNRQQRLVAKNGYTTAAAAAAADNDDDDNDDDELNYKREAKSTVHTLVPLAKPNVVTIKTIRAGMKDVLGERDLDLEQEYAPDVDSGNDNDDNNNNNNNNNSPLYQALSQAQTLYKEAKCVRQKMTKDMIKNDQKHVWIFTNVDAPRSGDVTDVPRKMKDMLRGDLFKILLWPFPRHSSPPLTAAAAAPSSPPPTTAATTTTTTLQSRQAFRYNLFYDKIPVDIPFRKQQQHQQQQQQQLGRNKKQTLHQQQQQQQEQLRDLVRGMMSKWTKVRARFHGLPLTFPSLATSSSGSSSNQDNASSSSAPPPPLPTRIVMDWYYMVQVHKEPTSINIHIQDGEPLQTVTQLITETGNEILVETVRGPGAAAYMRQQEVEGRDQSAKWRAGKRRLFSHVVIGHSEEHVPMSVQDRVDIRHACNRQAVKRHCTLIGFYKMPTTPSGGKTSSNSTNNNIPLTWCMGKSYLCLPSDLSGSNNNNNKASASSSSSDNGKKKTTSSSKDDEANLTAFAHLHASMLRKKVWALCELLTSVKTSQSCLAAMWPLEQQASPNQGNDDDDDDDKYYDEARHPPGMLVIPLPFADEIKEAPMDKTDAPMVLVAPDAIASGVVKMEVDDNQQRAATDNDAAFNAAVDLVKKLTFHEGTELGVNFENVRLQRYWNHIENTALELPAVKETDEANETEIDPEATLKRAGLEIRAFADSLPEDVKVEKAGKATSKKAAKVDLDEVGDLKDYFRRLYKDNALNERTMPDLKNFLKQENEGRDKADRFKLVGKKQDLINRISEIFEGEEQNETYGGVRVKQEDEMEE